jgi:hypothetical protein
MILGFRDKGTELFATGEFVRAFQGFDRQGWKRLEILEAALTFGRPCGPAQQSARSAEGRSGRSVFNPDQSAMANML